MKTQTEFIDPVEVVMPKSEPEWKELGRYGWQNVVVAGAQALAWAALLTVFDRHEWPLPIRIAALVLFCLMMQGVFTLLHEFCHRNAHADSRWNYAIGTISSLLFGTSATFLQVQHWGHHRRNRTASERGEFIHPGEGTLEKRIRYYFAILGGIWLACFLFPLLVPFMPYALTRWLVKDADFNSFSEAYREFTPQSWRRMQLEGLALWAFVVASVWLGPWKISTLAIAYAAFAFSWSSLQWIYHLNTPLHVVEGAYNLRLPFPIRWLFLNFNCNLTHHRSPSTPWQELYRVSNQRETQPLWYRYLRVFLPPRPFPTQPHQFAQLEKRYF